MEGSNTNRRQAGEVSGPGCLTPPAPLSLQERGERTGVREGPHERLRLCLGQESGPGQDDNGSAAR